MANVPGVYYTEHLQIFPVPCRWHCVEVFQHNAESQMGLAYIVQSFGGTRSIDLWQRARTEPWMYLEADQLIVDSINLIGQCWCIFPQKPKRSSHSMHQHCKQSRSVTEKGIEVLSIDFNLLCDSIHKKRSDIALLQTFRVFLWLTAANSKIHIAFPDFSNSLILAWTLNYQKRIIIARTKWFPGNSFGSTTTIFKHIWSFIYRTFESCPAFDHIKVTTGHRLYWARTNMTGQAKENPLQSQRRGNILQDNTNDSHDIHVATSSEWHLPTSTDQHILHEQNNALTLWREMAERQKRPLGPCSSCCRRGS